MILIMMKDGQEIGRGLYEKRNNELQLRKGIPKVVGVGEEDVKERTPWLSKDWGKIS